MKSNPFNKEFESLIREVVSDNVTCYYDLASLNEAIKNLKGNIQPAAHCGIYARNDKSSDPDPIKQIVLMQMRFDGLIGFPGGLVDPGEDVIQGLNRELKEEMNLDLERYSFSMDEFISCHVVKGTRFHEGVQFETQLNYFFAKEINSEEVLQIERRCLDAKDHGDECLGSIRVPLHVYREVRGFPVFLTHAFVGTSLAQLFSLLYIKNVVTFDRIQSAYRMHQRKY